MSWLRQAVWALALSWLVAQPATGQDLWAWVQRATPKDQAIQAQVDTTYLREASHRLHLRVFSATRSTSFQLTPVRTDLPHVSYEPNLPPSLGLAAHYGRLGLGVSIHGPEPPYEPAERGRSRAFTLNFQMLGRRSLTDVFFQRTRGYYLANPGQVFPGFGGSVFPQRLDVRTYHLHVDHLINFHWQRFSYRAAYVQTEVQRRSAGSWLLMPTVNYTSVEADSSLLPARYAAIDPRLRVRVARYASAGALGGYGHTFVWRKWFAHGSALLGANLGWFQAQNDVTGRFDTRWGAVPRVNLRLSLGYNGLNWFAVTHYTGDFFALRYGQVRYAASADVGSLAIGRRF